jgi:hypothetical protein
MCIILYQMPKKCECGKHYPSFNLPGEITRKWCSECPNKPLEAINVKNKKCECGKHYPSLNLPGEITRKWCFECPNKPLEATDVKHKKCECGKHRPSFNLPGEKTGKWCSNCPNKPLEAINVVSKRCECGKSIPSFNLPGEKTECGKHRPSLNLPGEITRKWCSNCPNKPLEAINVVSKRCECGKSIPSFNLPGEKTGKWCSECPNKPLEAINVKHKKCLECNLIRVNPKYEGHCLRCFVYKFPDKPNVKNYKIKENHVFDAVMELLPNDIIFTRDKHVGGCSKRRPDLMIDLGSHWICAENDENSHKDYDTTCEEARIHQLYEDMGDRPMVLIRFNCDKWSGGESLFKINKQGMVVIKNKKEFEKRIKTFVKTIKKFLKSEPPEELLSIEYLYYDDQDDED